MFLSSGQKITRGQALDVCEIDHELLKLFLPQIQSMFQYFSKAPILHSINVQSLPENRYDLSSLIFSSSNNDNENLQQQQQDNAEGREQQQQQQQQQLHPQQQQLQHDFYNPASKYITNVALYCLKGIMIYLTLIRNDIATPGMANLNVTFKSPSKGENSHRNKMYRYLFLSSILPMVHELMQWKRSCYTSEIESMVREFRNLGDGRISGSGSRSSRIRIQERYTLMKSIRRKLLILNYVLNTASFIVPPLQLYSFINHLWNHTSSPSVAMSLSDLQYVSMPTSTNSQNHRNVINFSYAQNRLRYEELMITLGMIIPLDVWKDLPSAAKKYCSRYKNWILNMFRLNANTAQRQDKLTCALCSIEPTIPYETNCGHIYCYICLRNAIIDGGISHYRCEICGSIVTSSRRYSSASHITHN